jgi:hypothetical protein
MEPRSRWRWIGFVWVSGPVALKRGDERFQLVFGQITQIALRQAAALEFGVFGEELGPLANRYRLLQEAHPDRKTLTIDAPPQQLQRDSRVDLIRAPTRRE